jgi:hypothetical protein
MVTETLLQAALMHHRVMSITAEKAAEDCWYVYEDGTLVGLVRPWPPGPDWKLVDLDGGLLSTRQFSTPQMAARFYPLTKFDLP